MPPFSPICFLRIIVIVILLVQSNPILLFAQNQKELDSLYVLLPNLKDTTEVLVLQRISRIEFYREPDKAITIANQALQQAKQLKFNRSVVANYKNLAAFYNLYLNDFARAALYLDSAEVWVTKPSEKVGIYQTFAMMYSRRGEFERSHGYLIRALEITTATDQVNLYTIYNNLGYNLDNLGRHREAIQFYKKCVAIAERKRSARELGAALANLGGPYMQLNEYDSAFSIYNRLYKIELEHGNPILNPTLLSELGKLYFEKGQPDTAYYFMHAGLRAAYTLNIPYAITRSLSTLGHYHLKARPDSALFYGRKLFRQINNSSALEMEDATFILAQSHGKLRRYDSSYFYFNKFLLFHDSVFQEKQTRQIAALEAQFNLKQKQQEIIRLESARQNEILKRNAFAGGLVLALIIALLMYFYLRGRVRARKKEIEAKNWQLENFTRKMVEKSELVEELRAQVEQFKSEVVIPKERIENVSQILNSSILTDDDWEQFKTLFEQVHRGFFAELKIKYPFLSQAEIRLAALVKLNLSTREMANVLGISVESANKARYRLRKKLELRHQQGLQETIEKLAEPQVKAEKPSSRPV